MFTVVHVGLLTTSSSMVGAAIGLYVQLSKRVLACVLAFAAGSLISALAIELAFKGAMELHHKGFGAHSAWALASHSLEHISRAEANKILRQAGKGAGMAIVLGNIHDTIPGCLVIGANFNGLANLSLTLVLGMFLGGIPEAAASAVMLTRAGYKARVIFALWATVLLAGMVAAALGKLLIGTSDSLAAVFCEAVAGVAVLALVAHTMIPEAIHEGGWVVVLPTVAGFLFALYLALPDALG